MLLHKQRSDKSRMRMLYNARWWIFSCVAIYAFFIVVSVFIYHYIAYDLGLHEKIDAYHSGFAAVNILEVSLASFAVALLVFLTLFLFFVFSMRAWSRFDSLISRNTTKTQRAKSKDVTVTESIMEESAFPVNPVNSVEESSDPITYFCKFIVVLIAVQVVLRIGTIIYANTGDPLREGTTILEELRPKAGAIHR